MEANEVRRAFVKFFESKGHTKIESASLVPHDDTLLFTNSGMVQFKPYFLGEQVPSSPRAVTVQKCVRAGGKHNDLDEVGRTSRHFTFFEMLGNFSFGDYFKEKAIPFAWEFVTEVLNLDPERIWITVHLSDDEAERIWNEEVGVPMERIQRLDEDNWWRMADTGPNGPCSEIFWDKGPEYGADGGPAHGGEDRFIEIWNLVFMQFETDSEGNSTPLPKPSIDTGLGLERIVSVLQNKDSIFEIDEMAKLIDKAEEVTGYKLGSSEQSDLALRVLAEHSRTTTFLISDGVYPSNEDRGYVLRRIMRRAIRFAYLLGIENNVLPALTSYVIDIMGDAYPELLANRELVLTVSEREETQFRRTLESGSKILDEQISSLSKNDVLDGATAFMLHDTYGFPFEVTQEVLSEQGIQVDHEGFEKAMQNQREQSKNNQKNLDQADLGIESIIDEGSETEFVGREYFQDVQSEILLFKQDESDELVSVYTSKSPFYAEAGGQVGDTGTISTESGRLDVLDTVYAAPGLIRHIGKVTEGKISEGQLASLSIDSDRRKAIKRNHTATHLLHWALREILGDHVQQQGSLVDDQRLRFDFSHFAAVTDTEITAIENLVNELVLDNLPVTHEEVTKSEAESMGAIAFFGDKYGEKVRVLQAGPSLEFCGGTHVSALGDIGCIKIISEGSIGSNIRRIEAVTGLATLELIRKSNNVIDSIAESLNVARAEIEPAVSKRLEQNKELIGEVHTLNSELLNYRAIELAEKAEDGVVISRVDELDRDLLQRLANNLKSRADIDAVVIGGAPLSGGAALVASVVPGFKVEAGDIISAIAPAIKGGGGKGPEFAMAGGKDPEGIDQALNLAKELINS